MTGDSTHTNGIDGQPCTKADIVNMHRHASRASWLRVFWPVCHGVAGFLFGVLVLHPASMVIFRWFDPQVAHAHAHGIRDPGPASFIAPILHSFHLDMAPMALVFGLFSAAIALINGYYRHRLALHRDELAAQAEILAETNRQLTRLEQTNRRHVQFMVHDFKGHLATIGGFAEHLLEKNESTWARADIEALTRIRRQSLRMGGAVMDLLEFARLQESPVLRREQASVSTLLETAAADLSLPTQFGTVEVGPRHRRCPDVAIDTRIIGRVLANLAFNALKHNSSGTRVVIDAHPTEDAGGVEFSCADDGRGIPETARASLFQFGARDGSTECEDSTGLGLAFCKAAVEAHGGRIWCESSEGKGTRFAFTVPLQGKREGDDADEREGSHPRC